MIRTLVFVSGLLTSFSTVAASIGDTQEPHDLTERVRPDLCGGGYFETTPIKRMDYSGYFPTAEAAIGAGAAVDESLFTVEVRRSVDEADWVATALYKELPAQDDFPMHKAKMERLGMHLGCVSYPHSR